MLLSVLHGGPSFLLSHHIPCFTHSFSPVPFIHLTLSQWDSCNHSALPKLLLQCVYASLLSPFYRIKFLLLHLYGMLPTASQDLQVCTHLKTSPKHHHQVHSSDSTHETQKILISFRSTGQAIYHFSLFWEVKQLPIYNFSPCPNRPNTLTKKSMLFRDEK